MSSSSDDLDASLLSNDQEFNQMNNSLVSFTTKIHLNKSSGLVSKYLSNTATTEEKRKLFEIGEFKDEQSFLTFLTKISTQKSSLMSKYSFLKNVEYSKKVIQKALFVSGEKGIFKLGVTVDLDCFTIATILIANCSYAQEFCLNVLQNPEAFCVLEWSNCLLAAYAYWDQCIL